MESKHIWKVVVFVILMFMSAFGGLSEAMLQAGIAYDTAVGQAFLYAIAEVCIVALLSMIAPLICRLVEGQKLPYKKGKRICLINAILTFVFTMLADFAIISVIDAIFFYFINKWVFVCGKESTESVEESQ